MGQVIASKAAVSDILDDASTSLRLACKRGGIWEAEAERLLGTLVRQAEQTAVRLAGAEKRLVSAREDLDAEAEAARLTIGRFHDEHWNELRRPAQDPLLTLLYPQGAKTCSEGPVEELPGRLQRFATRLGQGIHPRLAADRCQDMAGEIRAHAGRVAGALPAWTEARADQLHDTKTQKTIAQVSQRQLSRLKKRLLSEGFTQVQIHEVIPDRRPSSPRPAPSVSAASPTPVAATSVPAEATPVPEATPPVEATPAPEAAAPAEDAPAQPEEGAAGAPETEAA